MGIVRLKRSRDVTLLVTLCNPYPSQLIHAPLFHLALRSAMENFATDAVLKLCRYVLPVLHASCAFPTVNHPISQANGRPRKNVSCMQHMPIYTVYNMKVH